MKNELVEKYYSLDKEIYTLSSLNSSYENDLKIIECKEERDKVLKTLVDEYNVKVSLGDLFEEDGTPIISEEDK